MEMIKPTIHFAMALNPIWAFLLFHSLPYSCHEYLISLFHAHTFHLFYNFIKIKKEHSFSFFASALAMEVENKMK
jgi:hypothetical protein